MLYSKKIRIAACHLQPLSEIVVIDTILITLNTLINSMINIEKALRKDNKKIKSQAINKTQSSIETIGIELSKYQKAKTCLYTDYVSGDISKSDYDHMRKDFSEKCNNLKDKVKKLQNELYDYENNNLSDNIVFNTYAKYRGIKILDRKTAIALIDKITVDKEHCVKIIFKFSDEIKKYQYNL